MTNGGAPASSSLKLGFALSSEEHRPADLVRQAVQAEEAGFSFAMISDHYHPWLDVQGQSGFVWGVLGAIAASTERLKVGTGVTCPTVRIHPAIIAQAAATAACLMPGRFWLGVGTGENLNEHVLGDRWPSVNTRQEMLEEAIDVMRGLWRGDIFSHSGAYYEVENARIYSLPEERIPIFVAATGKESVKLAARAGDGLISTAPKQDIVRAFREAGNDGPRIGQVTVCWAPTEAEARRTATKYWPNAALKGSAKSELPLPLHFEELTANVTEDQVAETVICSPDAQAHVDAIREFVDAGFDHVYVHQVGHFGDEFFRFYRDEVLPRWSTVHAGENHE